MHNNSNEFSQEWVKTYIGQNNINGMGLCPWSLRDIETLIRSKEKVNIIEFGSGDSTEFLVKLKRLNGLNINITSFDNSEKYSYLSRMSKGDKEFLDLHITKTVQYSEKDWEKVMSGDLDTLISKGKVLDDKDVEGNFRIERSFYDVSNIPLKEKYDIVILDGPNGNGRSAAFTYVKNNVKTGTIIFVDDYWHYDFIKECKQIIDAKVLFEVKKQGFHKLHGYAILEVL